MNTLNTAIPSWMQSTSTSSQIRKLTAREVQEVADYIKANPNDWYVNPNKNRHMASIMDVLDMRVNLELSPKLAKKHQQSVQIALLPFSTTKKSGMIKQMRIQSKQLSAKCAFRSSWMDFLL